MKGWLTNMYLDEGMNKYKLCSLCGDFICFGEDYIKNFYGEYIHYDCMYEDSRQFLEWCGCTKGIMNED